MRTGFGYDSHRLVEGRKLILGGVEVPYERGLMGHSDADVLTHAIIDSILGVLGLGDIGTHYPDTDPVYKDVVSMSLLRETVQKAEAGGVAVVWVDATVVCEEPKLAPYIQAMCDNLQSAGIRGVNVKAKTNEGMGFVGRGEGIAAFAVCNIEKMGEHFP